MNAEKLVVDWLNTSPVLRPVTATLNLPATASSTSPGRYLTVERTGGSETPFVSRPLFAVQAWAESRWEASELANRTAERIRHVTDLDDVADVDILSITDFPSPDGRPRYQVTCQLTIKTNYTESEEA